MERSVPKSGERGKHSKSNNYYISGIASHTETKEQLVVYKALYCTYGLYVRPLEMFMSEVDHDKYPDVKQKYRFEYVKSLI